jgi:site-specific DNA-adenine methylase
MFKLFSYSGSKLRAVRHLRLPPAGVSRVVEPYLGSGAYTLNVGLPGVGVDRSERIVALWHWLQQDKAPGLHVLAQRVEAARKEAGPIDIRSWQLPLGPETYVKLHVCSVMRGQLSSWRFHPKSSLPVDKTIAALPRAANVQVSCGEARDVELLPTDLLFLDPPYIGTEGNYDGAYKLDALKSDVAALLRRARGPVIFTYNSEAPKLFPDLPWEVYMQRNVPNLRKGGTVPRTEYVAYLNFPSGR